MKPSGFLKWDVRHLAEAMRLTEEEVRQYYTDGRRVSYVVERRIAREVLSGQISPDEGKPYDVVDAQGRKWEVRSITEHGVYFCPSYMVGSGRSFDVAGFEKKLEAITGYVVADIYRFPEVPYWIVPVSVIKHWWKQGLIGSVTKVSRSTALRLLGGLQSDQADVEGTVIATLGGRMVNE